jgi:hypothetical protein
VPIAQEARASWEPLLRLRTYRVSHSITDYYFRDVRARSPQNALRIAQRAWDAQYERAFELDISRGGGNGDWEANPLDDR